MATSLLGEEIIGWNNPKRPDAIMLKGRYVDLEPLDCKRHAKDLFAAYSEDLEKRVWDYLPYGPFISEAAYSSWITKNASSDDLCFFAIRDLRDCRCVGVASYLRINPAHGTIEVGHIAFSPLLQSTVGATEAMYLMMKWVFEQGYRRYEWKCDALNIRSRRAAQRFGFSYEGIFRQAAIVKSHNRDTAWFAVIDKEWPILKSAYEAWLGENNFDQQGKQKQSLSSMTSSVLFRRDPVIS